jgi:hypothetical protein
VPAIPPSPAHAAELARLRKRLVAWMDEIDDQVAISFDSATNGYSYNLMHRRKSNV